MNRVMFSSSSDDWSTPKELFTELNKEFNFNLDVCAAKENAKCSNYYTKEQDGLKQTWEGTCWCNPPYGRKIDRWIAKAYMESKRGSVVVMLLPARTDTCWFHTYIYGKAEIRFLKGRLKFGGYKNSAPFPSMVVIYKGEAIDC